MNFAHLHLMINHIPMFTIPMVLIFLVYALKKNNDSLKKFSLMILIATSATVLPVYLTGEPAEEIVEHLPGISKNLIEAHEESAEIAMILTLVAGALAIATLITSKHKTFQSMGPKFVILVCLAALLALGYAANLGGKIRHPEVASLNSSHL